VLGADDDARVLGLGGVVRGFVVFGGEAGAFAAVEEFAGDVDADEEEQDGDACEEQSYVLVELAMQGVDDRLAVDDGDDADNQEAEEFAGEDGGGEGKGLHLEDTGGQLKDFEREGRRHHRGYGDEEELLPGEAVAQLLEALAVDALEEEEFASGASDVVGDEAAESRSEGCGEDIQDQFGVIGGDVADEYEVEGGGNGKEAGVDEGEAAESPDT
jgi:hypothetical protein